VKNITQNVEDYKRSDGKSQSDDPPAYERSGLELFDQTTKEKMELAEGLEPPTL
jgi:hypothetical protein